MTDNFDNDDFIEPEIGMPEEGDPKSGAAKNLSEAWKNRPLFKFMVLIIAVFAVGLAAVKFFGDDKSDLPVARLGTPPKLKEAPGGSASPYMRQQTELANTERAKQAMASGGSAIPTPVGQTADISGFDSASKKDDPLKELRAETEQLRKQVRQQQKQITRTQQKEKFDDSLASAMQSQLQQLMSSWSPPTIKKVSVSEGSSNPMSYMPSGGQGSDGGGAQSGAQKSETTAAASVLVRAGTVSYAQLLTEANSDVPGPVLIQIVSGPLAGARAIGSFQVAEGYEKYLVLKFNLANKKGKDYSINAIALDPDTTLGGMATEVDERYFARVILPAASAFLSGLGQALSQGGSSITTSGTTTISTQAGNGMKEGLYSGLGKSAETMSQFFQQQANVTKPLIRVAAGTPMGLFFVTSVSSDSAASEAQSGESNGFATTSGSSSPSSFSGSVPYPNYADQRGGMTNTTPYGMMGR